MSAPCSRVLAPALWLLAVGMICPAPARADSSSPPRLAFEERLSEPAVLAAAIQAVGRPPAVPVLARVTVERRELEPPGSARTGGAAGSISAAGTSGAGRSGTPVDEERTAGTPPAAFRFGALDQRLDLYASRKIPVWLAFDATRASGGATGASADDWARLFRALAPRLAGRVRVFELIVSDASAATVDAITLDLKRAAVELRAANPDIVIALGAAHQRTLADLERLYTSDLASYLDAVVLTARDATGDANAAIAVEEARAFLDRVDRTAQVYERGRTLTGAPDAAARAFLTAELWRLGSASALASYEARPDLVRAALARAATVPDLLAGELIRLDDRAAQLTLTRADDQPVRYTLLYDTSTFGTYLLYAADAPARKATPPGETTAKPAAPGAATPSDTARVTLTIATDAKPRLRDPLGPSPQEAGSRDSTSRSAAAREGPARDAAARRADAGAAGREVADFVREKDAQRTTFVAPVAPRPLIVDFNDAMADVLAERSEVKGRTMLSVGEIVARHQQAQAAQDAVLDHYTASARMEQHFRPSVADPGFDVVTENRFYVDRAGIEWEELSFSVNGSKWKEDRPAFPLLQPEKVLSAPLTLRLTDDYTYRLDGIAPVDGHDCYLVQFEPLPNRARSLYRGAIWIDAATFVQRKLQAVQTKLSAPVVSNEETHTFAAVERVNGREIVLPARTVSRQIVLVAGRNLLVEKTTTYAEHRVNGDDFRERRQMARASERIMYRDTDRGVRYYVKKGGQRVVSDRSTTSAKAMAMGVTLDPSFDFPLPIFGINYLDFDFGGPDSQLALLFGGVLALGNVQRPKLLGTPLDGSVDFFAIAVPGSDRVYDAAGEHEAERILTWPVSTGVNVGYQFTSFQKLSGQYQFRFDGYVRDRTTAEDYELPKSTTTHGLGLAYEYRRAGYSVVANGTWYGRARWAPWGPANALETTARTYERFSVNVSKDWFVGLFHKIHANGAYFGGRRLDRFSQYQFGLFDDTRIHGVPASGVRMSELAMARGSYSFNIFEQYRVDLFLEQAFGRDRDRRADWERITGLGVAMNVKGPWNTILRVDAGKSFLPERYRTNGSTVVQILMLKPLK